MSKKETTPLRTIKQYSKDLSLNDFISIVELCEKYRCTRNYFYSRYCGIGNRDNLYGHKQKIRDVLVKDGFDCELPARLWKSCLDDAVGGMKSMWSNMLNECSIRVSNHESLSDEEKHYIRYILLVPRLLDCVLNQRNFIVPTKINYKSLDFVKLNTLIRRLIRLCKGKVPHSDEARSFILDSGSYSYKNDVICIQSLDKGKRINIPVNTKFKHDSTIRIVIDYENKRIEVHGTIPLKTQKKSIIDSKSPNKVACDVNYTNVLTDNNGVVYGDKSNDLYNKNTNKLQATIEKRHKIQMQLNQLKAELVTCDNVDRRKALLKKIDNIERCNLGTKKYNNLKNSIRSAEKSLMRQAIRRMIAETSVTELVLEKFGVKGKSNNRIKNGKVMYKLSSWQVGEIRDAIEYLSHVYGYSITYVNMAYTSQVCSHCGYLQGRSSTDKFTCKKCGTSLVTHHNSAININNRSEDKEITVNMSKNKVKQIIQKRQEVFA